MACFVQIRSQAQNRMVAQSISKNIHNRMFSRSSKIANDVRGNAILKNRTRWNPPLIKSWKSNKIWNHIRNHINIQSDQNSRSFHCKTIVAWRWRRELKAAKRTNKRFCHFISASSSQKYTVVHVYFNFDLWKYIGFKVHVLSSAVAVISANVD